ncbi:MAG TPA: TIGR04376 family protein [Oscillatoriales bacterium UBA8482]|nr:MAG: TIGR04376 family protein [Oscillatoriales cyanobacterium CG2_30_40_61]HBW56295.1 TIGR04376 family protein [Oscillatoriales bacterium UBA8482]
MGLFEDFSNFFETRLDEFLKDNPHLELQALEEQLREQEEDTLRLIAELNREEKKLQTQILAVAQDVQKWHKWVQKAQAANRLDLVAPAQEREAAFLRQGNQLWGQMQGVKERIKKSQEVYAQVQQRHQEVKVKAAELEANRVKAKAQQKPQNPWETQGWNQSKSYGSSNSLESQFKQWEMDEELEDLKRNMGL